MTWGGSFLLMPVWDSSCLCTWMSLSFVSFEKFSAVISLNIFSMPLVFSLATSSTSKVLKFGLLTVSQSSWMFCSLFSLLLSDNSSIMTSSLGFSLVLDQ